MIGLLKHSLAEFSLVAQNEEDLHSCFQVVGETCLRWTWPTVKLQNIMGFVQVFIEFFLPLTIVIFCYSSIIFMLSKRIQNDQLSPGAEGNAAAQTFQQAKRNTLLTFIIVACCFILCWCQNQMMYLLYNLGLSIDFHGTYLNVTLLFAFLNCTVNPFIYLFKYRDYQEALKKFLTSYLLRRNVGNPPNSSPVQLSTVSKCTWCVQHSLTQRQWVLFWGRVVQRIWFIEESYAIISGTVQRSPPLCGETLQAIKILGCFSKMVVFMLGVRTRTDERYQTWLSQTGWSGFVTKVIFFPIAVDMKLCSDFSQEFDLIISLLPVVFSFVIFVLTVVNPMLEGLLVWCRSEDHPFGETFGATSSKCKRLYQDIVTSGMFNGEVRPVCTEKDKETAGLILSGFNQPCLLPNTLNMQIDTTFSMQPHTTWIGKTEIATFREHLRNRVEAILKTMECKKRLMHRIM